MDFDFTPFFEKYERLVDQVDSVFERVREEYSEAVRCVEGCADCCHALFDLTLIEALYLNHHFLERITGRRRAVLLDQANQADRRIYRIKRQASKDLQAGRSEDDILEVVASEKVRCPLLNDRDRCELYAFRPITCRLYGIPTSIRGKGHTCGKSGFLQGEAYPTVNLDAINGKLQEISAELVAALKSRYVGLVDLLVPVSMAMITDYNGTYLGVDEENPDQGA